MPKPHHATQDSPTTEIVYHSCRAREAARALATATILLLTANGPARAEPAPAPDVLAVPSDAFLASLGVCIHYAQGASADSYVAPLRYLGVRAIRDDFGDPEGYIRLRRETGVRVDLIAGTRGLPETIAALRRLAGADALLAVEGPNEPNNFPIRYRGRVGGGFAGRSSGPVDWTPVAEFQRDLYAAVKADPLLAAYPVFHVSEAGAETPNVGLQFLTIPEGAGTTFPAGTRYADYANVHNYVTGTRTQHVDDQAWNAADPTLDGAWDGLYGEYGRLWGSGYPGYPTADLATLPRVTTETGWDTEAGIGGERLQGTMLLDTYLSQFKRGWAYTFVYMLRDGEGGPGHQGLFHADSSPKLAATYIHNLTSVLAPRAPIGVPRRMSYAIRNQPRTTHDLLLQTAADEFALVVWSERASGSDRLTIDLPARPGAVDLFDPTLGSEPIRAVRNADGIDLAVGDHPVVLRIRDEAAIPPGRRGAPRAAPASPR